MNLFIVPGNPPAVHFYELWSEEIRRQNPQARVRVSSYSRFDLKQDSLKYLRLVAAAHAEELRKFSVEVGGPVTLVGHSLGGWMSAEVLKTHSEFINKCFLLQPFLCTPGVKGKIIIELMYRLHRHTPFERAIIKFRPALQRIVKDLSFVSDEEVRTSMSLTYHERAGIVLLPPRVPLEPQVLKKVHIFYTEGDTWCLPKRLAQLKAHVKLSETKVSHDFVVSASERAELLQNLMPHL